MRDAKDKRAAVAASVDEPHNWRDEMWTIHCRVVADMHKPGSDDDVRFLILGLAGEVGELANEIKKQWRDGDSFARKQKIRDEFGDALAYLTLLGQALGLDEEWVMLNSVLPKCRSRWPVEDAPKAPEKIP